MIGATRAAAGNTRRVVNHSASSAEKVDSELDCELHSVRART